MESRAYELRRGLLDRLLSLGTWSIGLFLVGYLVLGFRVLAVVELAYFALIVATRAYVARARQPDVERIAFVHATSLLLVIGANTVLLGGFLPSAGFAVWSYLPPLAALFLMDGRKRWTLMGATVTMLVALAWVDPDLTPVEVIPPSLVRYFFLMSVCGSLVVVIGSFAYFYGLVVEEQRALALSEAQHRSTLERLPVAVALKDGDGRIVFANASFERAFGVTRDEVARRGDALWRPTDAARLRAADAAARASETPIEQEETITVGDEPRTLRSTRLRVLDVHGEPLVCWVADDVTARRRAEQALQNERQLEALGTLAGGIAHDFNNLLMTIQGNVELAALHPLPPEVVARLGDADRAVARARELTRQILTFARGGAPSRALTPVRSVIQESATFALTGTACRLELDVPEGLPAVEVDAGQIGRVIHNLVLNASQAMPSGGTVRVRARVEEARSADEGIDPGRAYLRVDVNDRGDGIAAEHLPRVFDPFFTTRARGSGLGLTTCHSIVRQHDGAITLESEPGVGTTVSIFLPASEGRVASPARMTRTRTLTPSMRVLVMDDDVLVRDTLAAMLARLGHVCECCADGATAIDAYARAAQAGTGFDVVMLDLTVPGGMGGIEAARRLMAAHPGAALVAATGYAEDGVRASLRGYGFRAVLDKPFRLSEVARTLGLAVATAPPAVSLEAARGPTAG